MRVATWNINSIRTRVGQVVAWGLEHNVDVLLLQETKCGDADFPFDEFTNAGYEVAHHGLNHWNGVAIASRRGLTNVKQGFAGPVAPPYDEPRLMSAEVDGIRLWSIYVPNGRELDDPHYLYKLTWLERLRGDLLRSDAADRPTIVAGDFNVALGLRDVTREHHPGPGVYTWWNYRSGQFDKDHGLRLDLALCSDAVADRVEAVRIDRVIRGTERPSDHAPLVIDLPV